MNNLIKTILQTALLLSCTNLIVSAETLDIQYPNGVAAVVDNQIITVEDLQRKLSPFIAQLQRECTSASQFNEKLLPLAHEVLDRIINDRLLVSSFMSDKKLKVPESYLENHYTKFLVEHFQGNRSNYLEFLAAEGKTDREIREQQKEDVILGFLRSRMKRSESAISPTQIQKYYEDNPSEFSQKETVHLRQIVFKNETKASTIEAKPSLQYVDQNMLGEDLKNPDNIELLEIPEHTLLASDNHTPATGTLEVLEIDTSSLESKLFSEKTQKIIELLKNGEPFTEVAKKFSEDGLEKSGGDLGWVGRSDIRQELADVAFSLNKNQFSEPIILNDHTFILFIEDKKLAGQIPLQEVSDKIEKTLNNEYAKQFEAQYVQKLRKKAHIRYYL